MTAQQYDSLDNAALIRLAGQALASCPHLDSPRPALFCRSENATFQVTDAHGTRYALRIHRPNYHQQQEIESELQWLDALRAAGIEVPFAHRNGAGERVIPLRTDAGETRYAVLFDWIAGEVLQSDISRVSRADFIELGRTTARLHQHSRQWQRPAGFRRLRWDHATMTGATGHWGDWRAAPGLAAADIPLVERAQRQAGAALAAFGEGPDRFGLIHADLRLTNLMRHQQQTRVIDFDDCGFGWYLHDLAAAISFVEHHPDAPNWVEGWLEGYQQLCPLTPEERAIIPAMLIQRRIQLLAWVGSHAETEQARSLGADWAQQSVRLCRLYLSQQCLPVGAAEAAA
ncbi:phosphotransferase enzyme family protein [Nissabacter sp. SGAir0207]|uniref:phosphotransferase enzyme family protein n=1 Tax=Nissabacter sp. SGAir0207 TaxID=2126321 RepID=UPI0010CD6776|nr:phosphotransferase [Nissabacter sp. SGAir0207]QCR38554.1 serine kinase [Nissabacter sp. SGAir0207]